MVRERTLGCGAGKPTEAAVTFSASQLRPHQGQCELAGQQFVISQPRPERSLRQDVRRFLRDVNALQGVGEGGKLATPDDVGTDPFGQLRQFRQRLRDRLAQGGNREALGQRINRIDAG